MTRIFIFAVAASIIMLSLATAITQPRLIGYGCEGKSIPQLAKYEDEFPSCEKIEPIFD